SVICGPIGCAVDFLCRLLHLKIILLKKPLRTALCNKAFNMPAILKLWFDEVFTYQFAYGSQGDKLKDKKVIISMTVGQKEANMVNDQENLIDSFLKSVQHSIQYTQMQLSGTFLLYDVSPLSGNPESKIKLEAVEHGHKVLKHLTEA
ncbi:NAD(P)H-dependent oxidoreductase, partial [Acinetobacter baumannii]